MTVPFEKWRYDEWGHLINDFGCTHDGAPCNSCISGEPRRQTFFLMDEDDEQ